MKDEQKKMANSEYEELDLIARFEELEEPLFDEGFERLEEVEGLFIVQSDRFEAKIFFNPAVFDPKIDEVTKAIHSLLYDGNCTGCDISRIRKGEVKIYFNPFCQGEHEETLAIEKLTEVIRS